MEHLILDTEAQMAKEIHTLAPIFIGIKLLILAVVIYTLAKAVPQYRRTRQFLKQTKKAS